MNHYLLRNGGAYYILELGTERRACVAFMRPKRVKKRNSRIMWNYVEVVEWVFDLRSPLDVVKELNRRWKSSEIETPLDLIRELNRRWKSSEIETPLDLIRVLNRERRVRTT